MSPSDYPEWSAALATAGLGLTPAELHGSITGYLCAGWDGDSGGLLAALELEGAGATVPGSLQRLLDRTAPRLARRLRDGDPVPLLLPAGPLQARADALVEWCRGFLGGLGLTGVAQEALRAAGVGDVLDDFAHIAAAPLACEEGDEEALADVLDFVQAGVRCLHAALAPAGSR